MALKGGRKKKVSGAHVGLPNYSTRAVPKKRTFGLNPCHAGYCRPSMDAAADGGEAEELEWLRKQFDPTQHVPKGTAIKIQVRGPVRAAHASRSPVLSSARPVRVAECQGEPGEGR